MEDFEGYTAALIISAAVWAFCLIISLYRGGGEGEGRDTSHQEFE